MNILLAIGKAFVVILLFGGGMMLAMYLERRHCQKDR